MKSTKMVKPNRNSSLELLRIIAMFMIVFYHLILFFVEPIDSNPVYKAIQIPIHIGVILFVLISGYFGIRPSFRGFFRILCVVSVFYLPLRLWYVYNTGMGGMAMLDSFHVLSKTPYWFVRTYLCLYLVSPLINKVLKDISIKERLYYIFSFVVISVYLGMLQCDISLIDGKNLSNFVLIYIIGDTISKEKYRFAGVSNSVFITVFLLLNVILIAAYTISSPSNRALMDFIWNWSFPYYSPLLLVSSILFFIPFTRFTFRSRVINTFAGSVFSVYIIHHQPYILDVILRPIAVSLYQMSDGDVFQCIVSNIFFAIIVLIVCIMIDKLFSPIFRILDHVGKILSGFLLKAEIFFANAFKVNR